MNPLDKLTYLLTHSWSNTVNVIEPIIVFILVATSVCIIVLWPLLSALIVDKFLESKRWKPINSKMYDKVLPTIVIIYQIVWFCACIKTMYEYVL